MDEKSKIRERLRAAGINVDSIWDLVNTPYSYPKTIPVLIELLKEGIEDDKNREGIIRSLAVKEARGMGVGQILLNEYDKIPKEKRGTRWAVGNTMNVVIEPSDIDGITKIVTDKTNGTTRQMFVLALGKAPIEKVEDTLINLLDDEDVMAFAIDSLARLKSEKAIDIISQLRFHSRALIKKEAVKAYSKLSKIKDR